MERTRELQLCLYGVKHRTTSYICLARSNVYSKVLRIQLHCLSISEATGLAVSHIHNNTCISLICIWSSQIKHRSNITPLNRTWEAEEEQQNRQMQWLWLKHRSLHVQYVKQIVKIVTILWETYPRCFFSNVQRLTCVITLIPLLSCYS